MLEAETMADSLQEKAAVNFMRFKTTRQQISLLVYQSAAGHELAMLNSVETIEKLRNIEPYLASLPKNLTSQAQASAWIGTLEGSVGEDVKPCLTKEQVDVLESEFQKKPDLTLKERSESLRCWDCHMTMLMYVPAKPFALHVSST